MIGRRIFFGGAGSTAMIGALGSARADSLESLESSPAKGAVIRDNSSEYYVRFNQPVDHIWSRFFVKQNGKLVTTLQPRFKTEPEVLFARAPTLPPGDYSFHWSVRTMTKVQVLEGEVPFSVAQGTR